VENIGLLSESGIYEYSRDSVFEVFIVWLVVHSWLLWISLLL